MYLCVEPHLQILALRRQIQHRRSSRRRESSHVKRAAALPSHARHAQRRSARPSSPVRRRCQRTVAVDCLRSERLAKHARQLETARRCESSCHSPASCVIRTAPLRPPTPGARCTGAKRHVLERRLQRVLSAALSAHRARTRTRHRSSVPSPAAHAAARRASLSGRYASSGHRCIEHDPIGLAARLRCAPSAVAQPLAPRCALPATRQSVAPCSRFDSVALPRRRRPSARAARKPGAVIAEHLRPARRARRAPARSRCEAGCGALVARRRLARRRRATAPRPATQSPTPAALRRRRADRPLPTAAPAPAPCSVPLHLDSAMPGLRRRPFVRQHIGPPRQIQLVAIDAERRHERARVLRAHLPRSR